MTEPSTPAMIPTVVPEDWVLLNAPATPTLDCGDMADADADTAGGDDVAVTLGGDGVTIK